MKILIATPAYGNQVTVNYTVSLIETQKGSYVDGIQLEYYFIGNEALIQRARNKCAKLAIDKDFDKLFFIDADIGWTYSDFKAIINSPSRLIGGTYPLKCLPIVLNYNLLKDDRIKLGPAKHTLEHLQKTKELLANDNGELKVQHIPTGFMCIDVSVLRELQDKVPVYKQYIPNQDTVETTHDFFPVGVKDGYFLSEDWAFCEICRDNKISVNMNCNVIVNHYGSSTFSVNEGRK